MPFEFLSNTLKHSTNDAFIAERNLKKLIVRRFEPQFRSSLIILINTELQIFKTFKSVVLTSDVSTS